MEADIRIADVGDAAESAEILTEIGIVTATEFVTEIAIVSVTATETEVIVAVADEKDLSDRCRFMHRNRHAAVMLRRCNRT